MNRRPLDELRLQLEAIRNTPADQISDEQRAALVQDAYRTFRRRRLGVTAAPRAFPCRWRSRRGAS